MSTVDPTLTSPICPFFTPTSNSVETPSTRDLITELGLQKHPEGGYFRETDRDPLRVPNPFQSSSNNDDPTRSASTTIYYLLTPVSPTGHFHRNKGRTVHTLHSGRGRYVIIHGDEKEEGKKARIETFVVDMTSTTTVVPGFEFSDHDFMPPETLPDLLSEQQADELRWLLSQAD